MKHEIIRDIFGDVYNKFYLKHRKADGTKRTDDEWKAIVEDGNQLIEKYNRCKLIRDMVMDIQEEFELDEMADI